MEMVLLYWDANVWTCTWFNRTNDSMNFWSQWTGPTRNILCTPSCSLMIDRPAIQSFGFKFYCTLNGNFLHTLCLIEFCRPFFEVLVVAARKNMWPQMNGCACTVHEHFMDSIVFACYWCCYRCLHCHLWTLTLVFWIEHELWHTKMKGFDDRDNDFILFVDNKTFVYIALINSDTQAHTHFKYRTIKYHKIFCDSQIELFCHSQQQWLYRIAALCIQTHLSLINRIGFGIYIDKDHISRDEVELTFMVYIDNWIHNVILHVVHKTSLDSFF